MIEWLITDYNYIPVSIILSLVVVTILFAIFLANDNFDFHTQKFSIFDWMLVALFDILMSGFISFFIISSLFVSITVKPVGSSEWKTIYDVNQSSDKTEIAKSLVEDQKISEFTSAAIAANTSDPESNSVKIKLTYRMTSVNADSEIGERFANVFSNLKNSESKIISITASKSEYEKSKDFVLTKDNLIAHGDIAKSSKIVKVEIRTADYVETRFLGFKGTNKYIKPNEVRITLDNDSTVQQEVDKIFE